MFSRTCRTYSFLLFLALGSVLMSCEKCQSCYLMEEKDGKTVETAVGERCDQEIKDLESHSLVCVDSCYYECR